MHDDLGATATAEQRVEVAFEPTPGEPPPPHSPFLYDIRLSSMVIARWLPRAYLIDSAGRTLDVIDLATGWIERRFRFDGTPAEVSLSPDETRLAVLVSFYDPDNSWSGAPAVRSELAVFDTASGSKVAHHELPFAAGGLAAAHSWAVLSDLAAGVHVLDLVTGQELSAANLPAYGVSGNKRVALHPSERAVYAQHQSDSYASFALTAQGVIEPTGKTFNNANGALRVTADGRRIFSAGRVGLGGRRRIPRPTSRSSRPAGPVSTDPATTQHRAGQREGHDLHDLRLQLQLQARVPQPSHVSRVRFAPIRDLSGPARRDRYERLVARGRDREQLLRALQVLAVPAPRSSAAASTRRLRRAWSGRRRGR